MSIKAAAKSDFMTVKKITHTTIREVYPHYYPEGAVLFFLRHHSDESILDDITEGSVFLCVNQDHIPVGTVTLKENEICRLFVLPQFQGMGYGKELLDFAEAEIAQNYTEIRLDASFPGKALYLKRGYTEYEYRTVDTGHNDFLCYDIMIKPV